MLKTVYGDNMVTLKTDYNGINDLKTEISRLKTDNGRDVLRPQNQMAKNGSLKKAIDYSRALRKTEHLVRVRPNHFNR